MSLSTFLHSFIWATFVSGDGRNFDMLYAFCLLLIASAMLLLNQWGRRAGVIKYTGKYVKIYFIIKITFVTIHSLYT